MLFAACILTCFSPAQASEEGPQPPSLLGTWEGSYKVPGDDAGNYLLWMEVAYQKAVDGWSIRGRARWHVPSNTSGRGEHGSAESYTTFSGTIAKDGEQVALALGDGLPPAQGRLVAPARLRLGMPAIAGAPAFDVEVQRLGNTTDKGLHGVQGLDVSHHSGAVDWTTVYKNGYRFAYVKASEGMDNPDSRFSSNWQEARKAGLARGAYHFYVTEDDPERQAALFLSQLGDDPGELPPAVDVELLGHHTDTSTMSASLLRFLEALEQKTGTRPIIYTESGFWDRYYDAAFSAYPLWLSEFGVIMPKTPFGWDSWLFWQHRENVAIPGVEKSADLNLLHPGAPLARQVAAGS
jgi:lysozyme